MCDMPASWNGSVIAAAPVHGVANLDVYALLLAVRFHHLLQAQRAQGRRRRPRPQRVEVQHRHCRVYLFFRELVDVVLAATQSQFFRPEGDEPHGERVFPVRNLPRHRQQRRYS